MMGAEFELKLAEEQIAALKEALRLNKEELTKLERLARAADSVNKDAFYSDEDGPHFLVDEEYIQVLDEALKDCEGLY